VSDSFARDVEALALANDHHAHGTVLSNDLDGRVLRGAYRVRRIASELLLGDSQSLVDESFVLIHNRISHPCCDMGCPLRAGFASYSSS